MQLAGGMRLTQGRVDAKDLIWIESWIRARENDHTRSASSHSSNHLHQMRRCLIALSKFPGSVSITSAANALIPLSGTQRSIAHLLRASISITGLVSILTVCV
jgi:hypothetical protein